MKKILVVMLSLVFLLSSCNKTGSSRQKYWMRLEDGREIIVEYERCEVKSNLVVCWTDYNPIILPDASYSAIEFKRLGEHDD